jgi:predicted nucleotide-binding protein
MASGKPTPQPKLSAPSLVRPIEEVRAKLEERVSLGREIQGRAFNSEQDLSDAKADRTRWSQYNVDYLVRTYDNEKISLEYQHVGLYGTLIMNAGFGQKVRSFTEGIAHQINALMSIVDRLELTPVKLADSDAPVESVQVNFSKTEVFIVHGQDSAAKTEVARFVEKLGLKAVILHEQTNEGQTIIEKFEKHASAAGFAIVLLTPDDVGSPKGSSADLKPRARQNVILELGYFFAKLGRDKVCALNWPGVELPSDIQGIVYIPHNVHDGWRLPLAREMKKAGMTVDASGLL